MDEMKQQQFSVKEKCEILLEVEKGGIAKKYGISPSTVSTFLKQKSKIEQNIDVDAFGPQQKKMRTADYEEVGKAVYTWFVEMRAKNIPINGPLLCERARYLARSLGFPELFRVQRIVRECSEENHRLFQKIKSRTLCTGTM